jgi:hypothetical protein
MTTSLVVRNALLVGTVAASLAGCTYYKTYDTHEPPVAAPPPTVVVPQRAPDTVVVPQRAPNTVVVPAQPNTVIVPDVDSGPPNTIVVNPPNG